MGRLGHSPGGRLESDPSDPLTDGRYESTDSAVAPGGQSVEVQVSLAAPSTVVAVEIYLTTTDASGSPDFLWAHKKSGLPEASVVVR